MDAPFENKENLNKKKNAILVVWGYFIKNCASDGKLQHNMVVIASSIYMVKGPT